MQEIKAYVRKNMLDAVLDSLNTIEGLPGIAIVDVQGFGHHAAKDAPLTKTDMAKLEIDVPDELVAPVVETILAQARTGEGHPGDGKVFVTELREAIRIADGARGDMAVLR
ncbi:MAG: P-II family nitrogen regulator [Salinisphaeraceae bacterium]|uniref:P-II family nitrogen regulator n=2 Tax=Spectribacter TaxID=3160928 RepID=A0ABU3C2H3_9GAMM|nr:MULTISPECIES: P-II family nitrogen regulator [unclassified Salinisphaera]MDT0618396.1 P-II family nitrogen regulator [Salinisphaera sp. P385]MDT0635754.1 P-II family nitrogen regulator [Salinisphaera sp. W335]